MADDSQDPPDDLIGEVRVYGLGSRERVRQLIEALATIPVCPRLIFRISGRGAPRRDTMCRFVGVEDRLSGEIYVIQVHRWSRRGPVIGWSLRPQRYGNSLPTRVRESLVAFESSLGAPPMVVRFDAQAHADSYARSITPAS